MLAECGGSEADSAHDFLRNTLKQLGFHCELKADIGNLYIPRSGMIAQMRFAPFGLQGFILSVRGCAATCADGEQDTRDKDERQQGCAFDGNRR